MTQDEYFAALGRLNLKPHAKATAWLLGLSRRQIQKYTEEENPIDVPETVAKLLGMYVKHGIPKRWLQQAQQSD